MKYVNLFEEWKVGVIGSFTEKYDNIKPLPQNGYMNGNLDELRAIAKYLETKGYENAYNDSEDLKSIEWKYISALSPSNEPSYYNLYDYRLIAQNPNDTLHFKEYFKLKPEFRGHKMKKFGV